MAAMNQMKELSGTVLNSLVQKCVALETLLSAPAAAGGGGASFRTLLDQQSGALDAAAVLEKSLAESVEGKGFGALLRECRAAADPESLRPSLHRALHDAVVGRLQLLSQELAESSAQSEVVSLARRIRSLKTAVAEVAPSLSAGAGASGPGANKGQAPLSPTPGKGRRLPAQPPGGGRRLPAPKGSRPDTASATSPVQSPVASKAKSPGLGANSATTTPVAAGTSSPSLVFPSTPKSPASTPPGPRSPALPAASAVRSRFDRAPAASSTTSPGPRSPALPASTAAASSSRFRKESDAAIAECAGQPWFQRVSRQEAEAWLAAKPNGSYLVRPASVRGSLSLSHKDPVTGEVGHALVQKLGASWQIESEKERFPTLTALLASMSMLRHTDYESSLPGAAVAASAKLPSPQGKPAAPSSLLGTPVVSNAGSARSPLASPVPGATKLRRSASKGSPAFDKKRPTGMLATHAPPPETSTAKTPSLSAPSDQAAAINDAQLTTLHQKLQAIDNKASEARVVAAKQPVDLNVNFKQSTAVERDIEEFLNDRSQMHQGQEIFQVYAEQLSFNEEMASELAPMIDELQSLVWEREFEELRLLLAEEDLRAQQQEFFEARLAHDTESDALPLLVSQILAQMNVERETREPVLRSAGIMMMALSRCNFADFPMDPALATRCASAAADLRTAVRSTEARAKEMDGAQGTLIKELRIFKQVLEQLNSI